MFTPSASNAYWFARQIKLRRARRRERWSLISPQPTQLTKRLRRSRCGFELGAITTCDCGLAELSYNKIGWCVAFWRECILVFCSNYNLPRRPGTSYVSKSASQQSDCFSSSVKTCLALMLQNLLQNAWQHDARWSVNLHLPTDIEYNLDAWKTCDAFCVTVQFYFK